MVVLPAVTLPEDTGMPHAYQAVLLVLLHMEQQSEDALRAYPLTWEQLAHAGLLAEHVEEFSLQT